MLTYNGIDIEMDKSDRTILSYLDSFFDFDSLIFYIELTTEGLKRYNNTPEGKIEAILMCTKHNFDSKKYERFNLVSEAWDLYFYDHFIGYDSSDVNKSIAEYVSWQTEEIMNIQPGNSLIELVDKKSE